MQESHRERFEQVLGEWKRFINTQPMENPLIIPDMIIESWRRCREHHVNPYTTRVNRVLEQKALQELLERNESLIEISRPFLQNLYGFVRGSGFVVALFDDRGYMLEVLGDVDVVERVKKGNFIQGACWSEEEAGTNGCGTVLKMDRPVQVFATEHYCINSHKWTCSGAPIHDPDGDLIGVIDMTGPYLNANPHTLGMVAAAAYAIENDMRMRKALSECQIADGFQKTILASIPEALIAIDNLYRISMVNENAEKIIGRGSRQLAYHHVQVVIQYFLQRRTFAQLVAEKRRIHAPRRAGSLDQRAKWRHPDVERQRGAEHALVADEADLEAGVIANRFDH